MLRAKAVFSLICALMLLQCSFQSILAGTNHVVTTGELRQAMVKQTSNRQASLDALERLFSRPEIRGAVETTMGSPEKARGALSKLSDEELARLAQKATGAEKDFAAGALSNEELTYIVIALAAAVLVLIIVAAD